MEQLSRRTTAAGQVSLGRLLYYFLKRVVDIVGGSLLLVLFSPLILTIALAIWIDDGVPIVYRCQRLGRTPLHLDGAIDPQQLEQGGGHVDQAQEARPLRRGRP